MPEISEYGHPKVKGRRPVDIPDHETDHEDLPVSSAHSVVLAFAKVHGHEERIEEHRHGYERNGRFYQPHHSCSDNPPEAIALAEAVRHLLGRLFKENNCLPLRDPTGDPIALPLFLGVFQSLDAKPVSLAPIIEQDGGITKKE